ncbi:conserved hypothetical protein [Delftia phage PhiW-14]|uniref:Uncharacterized protein n=1 Tax=Delftia phage PhiW-14 TaxID=665032 RepID=C9DGE5_BPW14|nr:hypothetical protein DP-phiW-14_gp175 [Delftia phage PhiW-14]ACV50196.1 conserved hypothetical protein [Delftia phage PhiW-14]
MSKPFNPFRAALPFLNVPTELEIPDNLVDESRKSIYVCHAVVAVHRSGVNAKERRACMFAGEYIRSLLGKHYTVRQWLLEHCPEFKAMGEDQWQIRIDLVQAYRHRWLTHMADQFDEGLIILKD